MPSETKDTKAPQPPTKDASEQKAANVASKNASKATDATSTATKPAASKATDTTAKAKPSTATKPAASEASDTTAKAKPSTDKAKESTGKAKESAERPTDQPDQKDPRAAVTAAVAGAGVSGQTDSNNGIELPKDVQDKLPKDVQEKIQKGRIELPDNVSAQISQLTGKTPDEIKGIFSDNPKSILGALTGTIHSVTGVPPSEIWSLAKNPSTAVASTLSSLTGKSPEDFASALQSDASSAAESGQNAVNGFVGDATFTVFGNGTDKAEAAGETPVLGDVEQHAYDHTVASWLGGTLGGVTRTLGGTLGALGGGLGNTVDNTTGGWDRVGKPVAGGANKLSSGSEWTARAMENTTKGKPVQWQELTGDHRRA